jgi:hypothetical protein
MSSPELSVSAARSFDIAEPLVDQFVWSEPFESQSTFLGEVEVPVVRSVAEHARGYDVVAIVSVRLALWQKVIPGER